MSQTPKPYIELTPYADNTVEWLEQRRGALGSSDASTVTGMNKFKALYELWVEKTRPNLEPYHDERTLELFEAGHRMEPAIREWTEDRLGLTITKPERAFESVQYPFLHANVDGLTLEDTPRIFEAKNTSEWNRAAWENDIPDHAHIQVHHSGIVMGLNSAIVAGLIGGNTLKIYEVEMSENVKEVILERSQHFWEYNVLRDIPPTMDESEMAYKQALLASKDKAEPREIVGTELAGLLHEYARINAELKEMEKRKNALRNQILFDSEGAELQINGKKVASFRGGRVKTNLLFADHPELEGKYVKTKEEFDSAAFKRDNEELYRQYQGRSLNIADADTIDALINVEGSLPVDD